MMTKSGRMAHRTHTPLDGTWPINVSWPNANTFGPRYEVLHPSSKKPVAIPDRGWRWKKQTFDELVDFDNVVKHHDGSYICGKIWFDETESTQPSLIKYLDEVDTILLRSILSMKSDGGIEVEKIFGEKSFYSYPKPTSLIKTLIHSFSLKDGDLVLDFFAGSGTTGHAVYDYNAQTKSNVHFILVQLPEISDTAESALRAGFKHIGEVARERLRRVARQLGSESQSFSRDLGLRIFKLDRSNFKVWDGNLADADEEALHRQLEMHVDHIAGESTPEDILYELLLKAGFPLATKVEAVEMAGKQVFSIQDGTLLICLEDEVTPELIDALAESEPLQVICLDAVFKGNDQLKTNAVQTLKSRAQSQESEIVFMTV